MAERVRRFRVKDGYPSLGIKAGDIGMLVEKNGGLVMLQGPSRWVTLPNSTCVAFDIGNVEELHAFAVGDAVRVKAGVKSWNAGEPILTAGKKPCNEAIGGKLKVSDRLESVVMVTASNRNNSYIDPVYLEPWNDAEEWDGSKWVTKPKSSAERLHEQVMSLIGDNECLRVNGAVYDAERTRVSWQGDEVTVTYKVF